MNDDIFNGEHYANVNSELRVVFMTPTCKIPYGAIEGYVRVDLLSAPIQLPFTYYYSGDHSMLAMIVNNPKTLEIIRGDVMAAIAKRFADIPKYKYCFVTFTDVNFRSVIDASLPSARDFWKN